jgi:hypothetical protein
MFPKTYPQPSSDLLEDELNNTNNPFCSPPRTNNMRDVEFPFEEQSSPISFTPDDASTVPHVVTVSLEDTSSGLCISDASENIAIASQMNVNVPTPSLITSQDLPPITLLLAPSKRDTRRACVLPSETTVNELDLIRSTISKSKIINADDVVSVPVAEVVEISNDSPVQPQPWNVMNEIMNETVLDDDAVEEAVWAATHSFSTTSTMDGMQNDDDDDDEEQSVFVVKRPENLDWESKWTAFVTSSIDDDDFNANEWDDDDDQWERTVINVKVGREKI